MYMMYSNGSAAFLCKRMASSPALFVAVTIFFPLYGLGTLVWGHLTISFRVLYSVLLAYMSMFMPQCFDYCVFAICFEVRTHNMFWNQASSVVSFFLKIVLAVRGPLNFHVNFRMDFSILTKKNVIGISIRITPNL